MFSWDLETWEVKNRGQDPKVTSDRVQVIKPVIRNEKGQFHGATNFRRRTPKSAGTVSVVGQRVRALKIVS